jgi:hypothetical protein
MADNNKDNDDEDEEDDEDYVPGIDPDEKDDDENDNDDGDDLVASSETPTLSHTKRKAVDDAFIDLFGYPYPNDNESSQHENNPPMPLSIPTSNNPTLLLNNNPSKKQRKAIQILSNIFGKDTTSKLTTTANFVSSLARPKVASVGGMVRLEKRTIVEIKRFAGQEIKIERVVTVPVMSSQPGEGATAAAATVYDSSSNKPTTTATTTTTTRRKTKNVDNLLAELAKPDKISVTAKTAADWDLFKAKNTDLEEKLESVARGNEAYLVKKDFLGRVDQRQFEIEKLERERERGVGMKKSGRGKK